MSLADVQKLLNSEGEFAGFQFGLFGATLDAFYVDSLSIVTVVDIPDISLFA